MHFDERVIRKKHVEKAIKVYLSGNQTNRPARSAFLIHHGQRLPAKHIIRLAFYEATGQMVKSETLTGGRASVRVLNQLGFETEYDRPVIKSTGRNPIKSARRESFKRILSEYWGPVETEKKFPTIVVPDYMNLSAMHSALRSILSSIESFRGIQIQGTIGRPLAFDFFVPSINLLIEFDERQHFTPLRSASLSAYPSSARLGFDLHRWLKLSNEIRAGDNSPIYRDEQRAFYDSVRDILAPQVGFLPVVRIFEEDVFWEKECGDLSTQAQNVLSSIKCLVG